MLREIISGDAGFVRDLLNQPSFIKYIGDRGVRSVEQAAEFIDNRYRKSYLDHGFGLYTVELKDGNRPIGICGFVKRDTLPDPDLGFAFLPEYEGKGYGYESASEIMKYGRSVLLLDRILAITSLDNIASSHLLEKLGFKFDKLIGTPDTEVLKLYVSIPD